MVCILSDTYTSHLIIPVFINHKILGTDKISEIIHPKSCARWETKAQRDEIYSLCCCRVRPRIQFSLFPNPMFFQRGCGKCYNFQCIIWEAHFEVKELPNSARNQWNWLLPKPSSPEEFMINLSIQNFIPFFCPTCFCQDWGVVKKGGGDWNRVGLCGAFLGPKAPPCLPFLIRR